ncbi:MAG: nucleotide exchange factor GrpE [Planctomycetota bacterium]|nr:nucleotide exchange factor GrpE [Planctomycetota bacterium]
MSKKAQSTESQADATNANGEDEEFRVEDRRHWADEDAAEDEPGRSEAAPARPSIIEEYRRKTEDAESRLQEYIDAFKTFKDEQEQVRLRLDRDVDRKVTLKFGGLVSDMLEAWDDLELALGHAPADGDVAPLVEGLRIAGKRFHAALERNGVNRLELDGERFDPNVAEAVRMDPVERAESNGVVTETLRPGFRLDDHVIRPARVAVGRHIDPQA